jgi:K+ transporter
MVTSVERKVCAVLQVNYTLLVLCVAVVAGFKSSTAIGNAYGTQHHLPEL